VGKELAQYDGAIVGASVLRAAGEDVPELLRAIGGEQGRADVCIRVDGNLHHACYGAAEALQVPAHQEGVLPNGGPDVAPAAVAAVGFATTEEPPLVSLGIVNSCIGIDDLRHENRGGLLLYSGMIHAIRGETSM
jgi:hypothetical protein